MRLLVVAAALALSAACSTLSTVHGARTLKPGQTQATVALSAQRGGSPFSYAGFPLPQVEMAWRIGVAPDVDVGVRSYLLGTYFDTRYRFHHRDRLHLAIDPTLGLLLVPGSGGSIEAHAPLLAEWELHRKVAIMGGPRLILRDQWNSIHSAEIGHGRASRLDVFAGAGGRFEWRPGWFGVGLSTDLYAQPARHGGLSWSAGMDVVLRPPSARHP